MCDNSSHLKTTNVQNSRKLKLNQNESIDEYIKRRIELKNVSISSNRIKLNTSRGIWRSNERLVEVITNRNISHFMGFIHKSVKYLNPFEALFLMESESIEVYNEDIPLSIEESFQLFFDNRNQMDFYRVYALLSRIGYCVKRHEKCENTSQNVNSFSNCKRKLSLENNDSDYESTKHLTNETNCYELSAKISNYKSMTNIRPLNKDLLTKRLAIQTLNETMDDISEENTTDSHLEDYKIPDEQIVYSNQSIIYQIEDNETPLELDSSLHLFNGNVKPLCSLASVLSTSELYELIESYGPQSQKSTKIITSSDFDFILDVYKPDNKLSEAPLFHVIVTQSNESLPQFNDILYLKQNSRAQHFYFAVIDSGDVNFYSISQFDLNNEFPVLWETCLEPLTSLDI